MNRAIEVVEYEDEYKESCIELLESAFPGGSNSKTFEWRFESRIKNKPLLVCARDQDGIVSFNSWLPWEFSYEGKLYIGYQSGEAATDTTYRRQGIRAMILKEGLNILKQRQADFVFGFPSSMSYGSSRRAGHFPVGVLNYFIRFINPLKYRKNELDEFDIDDISDYPPVINRHDFTPVFDHDYFLWRYVKNPNDYHFVVYTEGDNRALFIVRENKFYSRKYRLQFNELLLVDCEFLSLNYLFIKNAIQYLSQAYSGKATWIRTFFNPSSERGKVFRKLFHIRLKSRYVPLLIKPINSETNYAPFLDFHNWDIMPHVKDAS